MPFHTSPTKSFKLLRSDQLTLNYVCPQVTSSSNIKLCEVNMVVSGSIGVDRVGKAPRLPAP